MSLHLEENLAVGAAFNQLLKPLIGTFCASTIAIEGNRGERTDLFSTVIFAGPCDGPVAPIDQVAAVAECHEFLTIDTLREAYCRLQEVKAIPKTDIAGPPDGDVHMTSCFVVARDSDLTLEAIALEVERLNASTPSNRWPDVVAILSKGIVNYAAFVPGSDRSGDLFLPAAGTAEQAPAPSLFISQMVRAIGDMTINKVASLVVKRVAIFQPGITLTIHPELESGSPTHGLSTASYQFNLSNVLVPVSNEQSIAFRMPSDSHVVSSGKKVLGSVQFREWQDGGVLIVSGELPMDLFLIFLRQAVPSLSLATAPYFRSPGLQVSYVLPIDRSQFEQSLAAFQRTSSNIQVRRSAPRIVIQKVGSEGTSSPFIARLMMSILNLRDAAFAESSRTPFDELYESAFSGLRSARDSKIELSERWATHRDRMRVGSEVRMEGQKVHLGENIDRAVRRDLESFLNAAVRTIKTAMQHLTSHFGVEIGFLFSKESSFRLGIEKTRRLDPRLADYLLSTREWSEPLVLARNDLEHNTIPIPKVAYRFEGATVQAQEPQFAGKPITEFVEYEFDRISCFVEELTTYCLWTRLPEGLEISEVPLENRDEKAPARFRLTVSPGGLPPWRLSAHRKSFEES